MFKFKNNNFKGCTEIIMFMLWLIKDKCYNIKTQFNI